MGPALVQVSKHQVYQDLVGNLFGEFSELGRFSNYQNPLQNSKPQQVRIAFSKAHQLFPYVFRRWPQDRGFCMSNDRKSGLYVCRACEGPVPCLLVMPMCTCPCLLVMHMWTCPCLRPAHLPARTCSHMRAHHRTCFHTQGHRERRGREEREGAPPLIKLRIQQHVSRVETRYASRPPCD